MVYEEVFIFLLCHVMKRWAQLCWNKENMKILDHLNVYIIEWKNLGCLFDVQEHPKLRSEYHFCGLCAKNGVNPWIWLQEWYRSEVVYAKAICSTVVCKDPSFFLLSSCRARIESKLLKANGPQRYRVHEHPNQCETKSERCLQGLRVWWTFVTTRMTWILSIFLETGCKMPVLHESYSKM